MVHHRSQPPPRAGEREAEVARGGSRTAWLTTAAPSCPTLARNEASLRKLGSCSRLTRPVSIGRSSSVAEDSDTSSLCMACLRTRAAAAALGQHLRQRRRRNRGRPSVRRRREPGEKTWGAGGARAAVCVGHCRLVKRQREARGTIRRAGRLGRVVRRRADEAQQLRVHHRQRLLDGTDLQGRLGGLLLGPGCRRRLGAPHLLQ
jgi:hypothetical protein